MYSGIFNKQLAKVECLQVVMNLASFDIDGSGTVTPAATTGSIALERARLYQIDKIKIIPLYFDQPVGLTTATRYRYLNNEQFAYAATMNATLNSNPTLFTEFYFGFSNQSIDNIAMYEKFIFRTDASSETSINITIGSTNTQYHIFSNLSYGNTGGNLVNLVGLVTFEGISAELNTEDQKL